MTPQPLTMTPLEYLQRTHFDLHTITSGTPVMQVSVERRHLLHVMAIGRHEKVVVPKPGQPPRLLTEDVLIGLYGNKLPLAFLLRGRPDGVSISFGTWESSRRSNSQALTLPERTGVLRSVLESLFPAIDLEDVEAKLPQAPLGGLVTGTPTPKPAESQDGGLPLDRLIRALSGSKWAALVLAVPEDEETISILYQSVVDEITRAESRKQQSGASAAETENYKEILKVLLKTYTVGQAVGMWRTGVYLLGDANSYHRLASTWRAVFSGDQSLPEPIRVWNSSATVKLATDWALPNREGDAGEGPYRHKYQYQTLLSSTQLAAYVHLPQMETSGFAVKQVPHFDAVPTTVGGEVTLGQIIQGTRATHTKYTIGLNALKKHAFVAGVTGAGKTNTILQILRQGAAVGKPFLVIEPAKTEYRALLDDPQIGSKLRIFTLGNENVAPFRLNPFEVLDGTPVGVHLDLLRSVFSASFGMWTPLPQILEQCLYQIYEDRGWDITTNTNSRASDNSGRYDPATFPTLSELLTKVDEVTQQLGYDEKVMSDLRAALRTRINSLRTGGKGRMLDVQRSLPMMELIRYPAVLELEAMGDDDDKAFVMGLLFIRLVEHCRALGRSEDLRHVLVIEEAHRLLTNVGMRGQEEANPRGKAVEAFANLLSEIRAYGQGVIIADQVPVKLAPDVIKNTNLKLAHRVVDYEDRRVLAGAMAMSERQAASVATFTVGQAAVYVEGDDTPLLVAVDEIKEEQRKWPDNDRVRDHMASFRQQNSMHIVFAPHPGCADTTGKAHESCQAARRIAEHTAFRHDLARFVLAAIEDDTAPARLMPVILAHVDAVRRPALDEHVLRRCLMAYGAKWFASRRGAEASWAYSITSELAKNVHALLAAQLDGGDIGKALAEFRTLAIAIHTRTFDPYLRCSSICKQVPRQCLYRFAVVDLINSGTAYDWIGKPLDEQWELCSFAGYQLIGHPAPIEAIRRAGLCYAQISLTTDPTRTPVIRTRLLDELIETADGWLAQEGMPSADATLRGGRSDGRQ